MMDAHSNTDENSMSPGPLWRQLADAIEDDIRSGSREPGSKLPSVAVHAAAGISQATSTRAYRELADRGLVYAVPGSGTFVTDPVPESGKPVPVRLDEHEERILALEKRLAAVEAQFGHDSTVQDRTHMQ